MEEKHFRARARAREMSGRIERRESLISDLLQNLICLARTSSFSEWIALYKLLTML